MNSDGLIKQQEKKRDFFIKAIVESLHPKKIIISGPGTGKTYLFGEILKQKSGKYLVLTFINNLADKLNKDLGDKARCCTFHSFCKSLLHKIQRKGIDDNFILYPNLDSIIKSDAQLLLEKDFNFLRCFRRLNRDSQELLFFIERSNYYNAVSFDDSVFRVVEHFEQNPTDIPEFEQILVDEYQDFNKLEVTFIDLMGNKNPLLIVGDDDQALYGQLKDASAEFIRNKYYDKEYKHFELPYCSRCTGVIIDAIHDVIRVAKNNHKLSNRVDRKYFCYLPGKLKDSKRYPFIIHAHCSTQSKKAPYIAKFIEQEICRLTAKDIEEANMQADCTILITGPHHYLKQINSYLKHRKEWLISYRKDEELPRKTAILEGYRILVNKDRFSNLGWRIILEYDRPSSLKTILKDTVGNNKRLYDYLLRDYIEKRESNIESLKCIKNGLNINEGLRKRLEANFGYKIDELRAYILEEKQKEAYEDRDHQRLSIILTTYVGCKGLSAGYVFAVGLNESNLPKSNHNPTDIEICQFIVILARTMKKCYLLSVGRFAGKSAGLPSTFIWWINKSRIKEESIDKNYRFGDNKTL